MNIQNLKNPSEASKAIEALRKRFRKETCMAPSLAECSGPTISAHTLSVQAMLRPISRDGYVYSFAFNHYSHNADNLIDLKLTGLRNTSVFNGFCAAHDKSLFLDIEDQPFICSRKQLFLYAFRATARESYMKKGQIETFPTLELAKKIHEITEDVIARPEFLFQQEATFKGAEDMEKFKAKLNKIFLAEEWSRLVTTVIQFSKVPTLICSSLYAPIFDFNGNYLQEFEDAEKDLDYLLVTIIPSANGGFALLSYLDTSSGTCEKMVQSLLNRKNHTTSLIWLVIGQFENFAISPAWHDSQNPATISLLKKQMAAGVILTTEEINCLQACPDFIDDWNPVSIFKI